MGVRRFLGWAIVAAVVAAGIWYGMQPQPVLVDAVTVTRGPLRVTIQEEGRTRVVDRFVVSAPVTGTARRLRFDVGDRVVRGQQLLLLDPVAPVVLDPRRRAEARALVAAAEARLQAAGDSVESAKADTAYWETELARVEQLFAAGTIARQRVDSAEASERKARAVLRAAESQVGVAEHEIEAAKSALEFSATQPSKPAETVVVRAPVAGEILTIHRESEGVIREGAPILEIGDARGIEVVVEALSTDAVQLGPGTKVLLERWGGARPLEARVKLVEPTAFTKISALGVEEQRVLVLADIVSPPEEWERLGDGYRVEASFVLWESEDVLRAPASSLFREGDGWAVFAVEEGFAVRRGVEVGERNGLAAEVLGGLSAGDVVIAHPDAAISEGIEVELRAEPEATSD